MQRNFMIKLRQFVSEPEIESDDVEYYINRAQEEYVKQQHLIIKDNKRNEQFSSVVIQSSIENIRTLVKQASFAHPELKFSLEIFNGLTIDLSDSNKFPDGKRYAFYLRSRLTDGDIGNSINCRIIDTNIINQFTKTKYNTPLFREPAIVVEGDNLTILYPSDFNIPRSIEIPYPIVPSLVKYFLTYITKPPPVDILREKDCILPPHTHNEIVDMAVNNKIEDIQKSKTYREEPQQPARENQRQ